METELGNTWNWNKHDSARLQTAKLALSWMEEHKSMELAIDY